MDAKSFPVHIGVDCAKTFHKMVIRGPDGRRRKAVRIDVSKPGFDEADRHVRAKFPGIARKRVLFGLELAGCYGATFAYYLRRRGYSLVAVLRSRQRKREKSRTRRRAKMMTRTRQQFVV
jgi:hypothetical protein